MPQITSLSLGNSSNQGGVVAWGAGAVGPGSPAGVDLQDAVNSVAAASAISRIAFFMVYSSYIKFDTKNISKIIWPNI
jgi:hypothetical protein